jgi:hypothetical protein
MSDTSKATVTVVAREGFNGFWSAGKHFSPGENLVELTASEQAAVEADAALGLPISVVAGWPEASELAALEAEEQAVAAKSGGKGKK